MYEEIRKRMGQVLELLLWLVAVFVLLQVLFGADVTKLLGFDVINNLGVVAGKFGDAGLVGVVAAAFVAFYIIRLRNRSGSDSE